MEQAFIAMLTFKPAIDISLMKKLAAAGLSGIVPLARSPTLAVLACSQNGNALRLNNAIAAAKLVGLSELIVIACGDDWCAANSKPYSGWLTRHLGSPKSF